MRFACFALSLLAVSARLAAQALPDSSGLPGSPDAHDAGETLPAVTVTVNKQSQPLDAVAAGVTAFAGEELASEGVRDLQGVAQMTPGLTFQPVGQSSITPPVMRGMTANIVGFSSAVALLVDGVPTLRGQGFGDNLLGAQSVEVLRGPQSTLYGRNAQAGVISVVTRQPGDAPYALLSAESGSRRRAVLRADASRALNPGRAYLGVAGEFMRQDGFIRNLHTGRREDGRQQYNGRLTLRLTPSARTEINLRASARRDDDGASAWGAVAAPRATVRSGWPGSNTSRGHTLSADVTHDFGGGLRLRSITASNVFEDRLQQDTDFMPADLMHVQRQHRFNTLSQELRLQGRSGRGGDWLLGLYADRDRDRLGFVQKTPLALTPTRAWQRGHTLAAFTHWNIPLTGPWTLTLGARIERSRLRFGFENAPAAQTLSQSGTRMSPKVAVQYAARDALLWASVADGLRAAGFNAFAPVRWRSYGPERARSFELGVKGQPGRRLRYTAALYYTRLHNMQVQQMGAPGQVFITNAASATSRGAELEAEWLPARSWLVQAGVALNRTRFGHFSDGANRYDGHLNPMTPAATAHLGLRYDPGPWYAQVRLSASRRIWLDAANLHYQSGHALLDLSAGWRMGRTEISAWVRNAGNRRHDARGFPFANIVIYSPPRELGLRVIWRL